MNFIKSTHRNRFLVASLEQVTQIKQQRSRIQTKQELTLEDETRILSRCCSLLASMHALLGLGPQHASFRTAVHFLRRTFLLRRMDELNPELTALACLFLAGKVEEVRWPHGTHGSLHYRGFTMDRILRCASQITASQIPLTSPLEVDAVDVLVYERVVLETLDFSLLVHGPRNVRGKPELEQVETLMLIENDTCLTMGPDTWTRAILMRASSVVTSINSSSSSGLELEIKKFPPGLDESTRAQLERFRVIQENMEVEGPSPAMIGHARKGLGGFTSSDDEGMDED